MMMSEDLGARLVGSVIIAAAVGLLITLSVGLLAWANIVVWRIVGATL
jgi:hypothetical protein